MLGELGDDPRGLDLVMLGPRVQPEDRRRRAKTGGLSTLVSSMAVHNVMAERRPDLLERKRHLPRLWLSPPNARRLPPVFAEAYGTLTIGDRGGIICKDTIPHAPLTPTGSRGRGR